MAEILHSAAEGQDLTNSGYWNSSWVGRRKRFALSRNFSDRLRQLKDRSFAHLLLEQVNSVGAGELQVCELGCAPGGILTLLNSGRPGLRLSGLDFSADGLAVAEQNFQSQGLQAQLHFGDLRSFEPPSQYDFVYSCGLVEHFTDPLDIIKHHARICRPGGRVLITVPNYTGYWQEKLIAQLDPPILETHNLEVMQIERLRFLLQEAGLTEIEAGGSGTGKFCTTCTVRNWQTQSLRLLAKGWNIVRRMIPLTPNWHCNVWAAGRVPEVILQKAG